MPAIRQVRLVLNLLGLCLAVHAWRQPVSVTLDKKEIEMNDVSDTKYVKVFIGRFQPFHLGHLKVLRAAIDTADHVVVIIGSASTPSRA
jgi:hypothetical protein